MTDLASLIERLERDEQLADTVGNPIDVPINPDGPEAADALRLLSAEKLVLSERIAVLEDLPRLFELERTAAPDCGSEHGWNAGLDRAAAMLRASLIKEGSRDQA